MPNGIYHEFIAERNINKPSCEEWNQKHKFLGLLGYELVETKNLPPGTTSCTFSGLDGDTDEEYFIEAELAFISGNPDNYLKMLPNGLSTNQKATALGGYGNLASPATFSAMVLVACGFQTNNYHSVNAWVKVKTGNVRSMKTLCSYMTSSFTYVNFQQIASFWNETTINISSLEFVCLNNSFGGTIRLWKKIAVE